MPRSLVLLLVIAASASATEPNSGPKSQPDHQAGVEFFERRIRPIFVEHCYSCHSSEAKRVEGNLRLDSPAALLRGGDSGAVIEPGKPEESILFAAVSYSDEASNMPPEGKLSDRALADVRRWIELGAPLPKDSGDIAAVAPKRTVVVDDAARNHWSFRPTKVHDAPAVSDAEWPRQKIDYFILARLDARQLRPAPAADRRTLIRRLSFDLRGLPPSLGEIAAFVADADPAAYERLVERMLASPQYGERWARHWLDVVRYGEDNPTNESTCKPPEFPFRYRDWVVQALNNDLPYDEFLRRQLAADLMPELPTAEIAATGFLGLSPVYHKEPKLSAEVIAAIVADEWDERIDMLTRGVLGLTVACARCHDHKFDPIRTQDYYALAGVMASTRLVEWPLTETSEEQARQLQNDREALVDTSLRLSYAKTMRKTAEAAGEPTAEFEAKVAEYDEAMKRLKERKPFVGPVANAVCDAGAWVDGSDPNWTSLEFRPGVARDLPVFVRGNPARHGELAPRRFIEVLSEGEPQAFQRGSGRLELADAIVSDAAGLTARVIVNRAWGWHFGQPLVRTPSNFGALGEVPSHPELLDDLAARFIAAGWSLKWLHREMVLSAAYQMASVHPYSGREGDPAWLDGDNRLLWRMHRRRLEPEAWRDAVLSVAGRLDLRGGGPSAELNDEKNARRTLYGKVSRQNVADVLRLFDFPDAKQHAEERLATTTPLQQLYLLNSRFVFDNAAALAGGDDAPDPQPEARLRRLFLKVLQREPSELERAASLRLLAETPADDDAGQEAKKEAQEEAWRLIAHGLLASNEFLHVD